LSQQYKSRQKVQRCHFQRPRLPRSFAFLEGAYDLGGTTDFTSLSISIGHERQSAIKGVVVNVPIPVSNIATSLPQALYEAEVIQATPQEMNGLWT